MAGASVEKNTNEYIDHIDGIRAIAVMLVVIYHQHLSLFTGGFIGVDVFFVISGYLITKTIAKGSGHQGWLLKFYAARARRIVPTYLVMVGITMIVACFLFLPIHLEKIKLSAASTLLFLSNFVFWRTTSYFSPDLTFNPLLHTWSLALEWQFYLVFPAIFAVLRLNFRLKQSLVVIFILISFALACALVWNAKNVPAFYLLPARLWEFLVGCWVAQNGLNKVPEKLRNVLLYLSASVLLSCAIFYDSGTAFPGLAALPVCIATAVLIKFGSERGLVNRMLTGKKTRLVGQASYSIYLWHWPVIVFFDYLVQDRSGTLGIIRVLSLTLLSLALGFLSWKYIESPLRNKSKFKTSRVLAFCSWPAAAALVAVLAVHLTSGLPVRFDARTNAVASEYGDMGSYRDCLGRTSVNGPQEFCKLGAEGGSVDFVVLGDSHAAALADGISSLAKERGRTGVLVATDACPPFFDFDGRYAPSKAKCKDIQSTLASILEQYKPKTVILHAVWRGYMAADQGKFNKELDKISSFLATQAMEVIIIDDTPGYFENTPILLAKSLAFSWEVKPLGTDYFKSRNAATHHSLKNAAEKFNFVYIDTSSYLCEDGGSCKIELNGLPMYWDDAHLTGKAAQALTRIFFQDKPLIFQALVK